jgi:hypothetical protein
MTNEANSKYPASCRRLITRFTILNLVRLISSRLKIDKYISFFKLSVSVDNTTPHIMNSFSFVTLAALLSLVSAALTSSIVEPIWLSPTNVNYGNESLSYNMYLYLYLFIRFT